MINEQTIEDGNKLIAEFMGFKKRIGNNDHYKVPIDKEIFYQAIHLKLRDMPYSSSWDWLMPVVEKIEETATTKMEHRRDYDNVYDNVIHWCWIWDDEDDNPVAIGNSKSKIQSVWLAVVDFIKWYNETQKIQPNE